MTILICGSRNWVREPAVRDALICMPKGALFIHGGCSTGADYIAHGLLKLWGLNVRVYQADWGKYGRSAGPIRNQRMLDENDVRIVVAFLRPNSLGTQDMMRRAMKKGIPVVTVRDSADDGYWAGKVRK